MMMVGLSHHHVGDDSYNIVMYSLPRKHLPRQQGWCWQCKQSNLIILMDTGLDTETPGLIKYSP